MLLCRIKWANTSSRGQSIFAWYALFSILSSSFNCNVFNLSSLSYCQLIQENNNTCGASLSANLTELQYEGIAVHYWKPQSMKKSVRPILQIYYYFHIYYLVYIRRRCCRSVRFTLVIYFASFLALPILYSLSIRAPIGSQRERAMLTAMEITTRKCNENTRTKKTK